MRPLVNNAGADTQESGLPGAERALPYARLLRALEVRGAPLPQGWALAMDRRSFGVARRLSALLADLRLAAFVDPGEGTAAVAILGTRVNLRGVFAVLRRRLFGGSSSLAIAFVDLVRAELPGHALTVVGHSSGGGIASHVGAVLGLPSITFNGARTRSALLNDGSRQLNVIVRGDFWGDPGILPGRLAGETMWLDAEGTSRPDRHSLPAIVLALERAIASGGRTTGGHEEGRGLDRSAGRPDSHPFVLPGPVVGRTEVVHRFVSGEQAGAAW